MCCFLEMIFLYFGLQSNSGGVFPMNFRKLATIALSLIGISAIAAAATPVGAPEIDPGMGLNAIALLGGLALTIRARRRK